MTEPHPDGRPASAAEPTQPPTARVRPPAGGEPGPSATGGPRQPQAAESRRPQAAESRQLPAAQPRPHADASPERPRRRSDHRSALIFAIVGIVLALAAGGLYLRSALDESARDTPDEAVRRFLAQTSLLSDRRHGNDVVCSTWDPSAAVAEMARQVGPEMDVSWDNIVLLKASEKEATVLATLNTYRYGQTRPSSHRQWRFGVVQEDGWRVCAANSLAP